MVAPKTSPIVRVFKNGDVQTADGRIWKKRPNSWPIAGQTGLLVNGKIVVE
jgi:hypothetical protein